MRSKESKVHEEEIAGRRSSSGHSGIDRNEGLPVKSPVCSGPKAELRGMKNERRDTILCEVTAKERCWLLPQRRHVGGVMWDARRKSMDRS